MIMERGTRRNVKLPFVIAEVNAHGDGSQQAGIRVKQKVSEEE